ncbi:MAG: cAMP/cGMP-dependent 3',5'-cyclic-AMP/GMP phosphodiesterase [Myxococcales bacterium]|nr:cAMP/cGMP-dependent 3',5'-cyclic-AMP/GMP phosphodiesterase [Myxococcales bacterium]
MSEGPRSVKLPRGGIYLPTPAGPVQVGVPPETIKDSMALGIPLPDVFVIPPDLFDRRRGLTLAEIEFPAYFNYFVLKRRARLVVETENTATRLRTMMRESLFASRRPTNHEEFASSYPVEARPDFLKETDHFRRGPDGKCKDVDDLVEFCVMTGERAVVSDRLSVEKRGDEYVFVVDGEDHARTPATIEIPDRITPSSARVAAFEPPAFGLTVLGASHGFDPDGKTTGYILWIGRRGILIDPPVDTTMHLRDAGVMPKTIDGVILTHCHADHDSGVFAKLLEEGRTRLITTPTILASFLKKYSALSGIDEDALRRTFSFVPVKIGQGIPLNGAELIFHYTLHSIPTIGFEAFYGGKSLAFSSDTLYEPESIRKMCELGVITPERRDALIDFPWHHSLIFHEAGVPPLHTPVAPLAALPPEVKERLYLVHIARKDVPKESGLKSAEVGLDRTMRIDVEMPAQAEAIDVLNVFCSIDFFRELSMPRARELLLFAKRRNVEQGETIISQDSEGHEFFVIVQGSVSVMRDGQYLKSYHSGDYFGETALVLNQPRTADVVARTPVELLTLDRHAFLYLLRGTDIPMRLVRLARAREARTIELFSLNSALRQLSGPQKTQLQTYVDRVEIKAGDVLWKAGDPVEAAFVLDEGHIRLERPAPAEGEEIRSDPYGQATLFANVEAMRDGQTHDTTARVLTDGHAFRIAAPDLLKFLQDNPGVLLSLLGREVTE